MPGTPLLVQQPLVSLLREVEENLRLTLRSQAALESAASTAGSERHRQSRSAEQSQQQQRRQTASAATSLRSSIAKSTQRQASAPAAGCTVIPEQLSFNAASIERGSPAWLPQIMRALPSTAVTPPPGESFWISNQLADSASGRTASPSTGNAAGGYLGSPIHSAIGSASETGSQPAGSRQQSSAEQRDPQIGLQKENTPAGSSKALGYKRSPQAANRPSDLRYNYPAARARKREDLLGALCSCALGSGVLQQQAVLLAGQARSAQAAVDNTFSAVESEMQHIISSLQARTSSSLGNGSGANLSLVDTREADRSALSKQTAEIASLEDALKEISACLARSLRQNICLTEETAELRHTVALLQCNRQRPDTPSGSEAYKLHNHRPKDVIIGEESSSAALAHCGTGGGGSVKQTNEFAAGQPQGTEMQQQAAAFGSMSASFPGSGRTQTAAASVRAEDAPPASTGRNPEHAGLHDIQGAVIANQVSQAAARPEASSSKQGQSTASASTGRADEGSRSGALQHYRGGASLTEPAARPSSPSRQDLDLDRGPDCTLSESGGSRHGKVRWLRRSGWERTKSSWDTPSPPVMSAKGKEALQAALAAIRQLEESSDEEAVPRSSPLHYQSSSNRNRSTRDSKVAAGKPLRQRERLLQQICRA